jgi:hypothetical protein
VHTLVYITINQFSSLNHLLYGLLTTLELNLASNPLCVSKLNVSQGFLMPNAYEGFDVRQYQEILDRTLHRYGLPPGAYRSWRSNLNYRVFDLLGYMQPVAPLYWQNYIYNALMDSGAVDRPDTYMLTLIDKRWHFGEREWAFSPTKIEHQVRRALSGLNYIVMIEFEVFGNVRHLEDAPPGDLVRQIDRGRVIAPHVQGLIWGRRPSRRQRAQFAGGIFGAGGVFLKPVTKFAGAVRYMVKPPYLGQRIHPRAKGGRFRYSWKLPLKLHHLLFSNLFDYSYADLTFASGEGSSVLARAKRLWRDGYLPVNLQRYAYPQQPFHHTPLVRRPERLLTRAAIRPRNPASTARRPTAWS